MVWALPLRTPPAAMVRLAQAAPAAMAGSLFVVAASGMVTLSAEVGTALALQLPAAA